MPKPINHHRMARKHLLFFGVLWCVALVLLALEDDRGRPLSDGGWMALSGWLWTLYTLWLVSRTQVESAAEADTAAASEEVDR